MSSSFVPPVQSDQFNQSPIMGDLDLAIMKSGVLTGTFYSATSTDTIAAGLRVAIDTSYTGTGIRFVAVADNVAAFGAIKRTIQKALFSVGDVIEVAYCGGPAMVGIAAATVRPGESVEMASGFIQEHSAGTVVGLSLDYAAQSNPLRFIIGFVSC